MTMKRYLVTGGAGFIGSAVARKLIRDTSHQVLVVDKLTYAGNLNSLDSGIEQPALPLRDRPISATASGCARSSMRTSRTSSCTSPRRAMSIARSTGRARSCRRTSSAPSPCLQAALHYWRRLSRERQRAFRFHHVSTDEVFGSLGDDGLFHEEYPYQPTSPYSASKAASDHFVRAWHHTYGLPTIVTNCSNNYGPYHFPEKLIPLIILNALEGKSLPVYGKGENVRDWLFVEDHARGPHSRSGPIGQPAETFNIGGHNERTQHRRRARDLRARR